MILGSAHPANRYPCRVSFVKLGYCVAWSWQYKQQTRTFNSYLSTSSSSTKANCQYILLAFPRHTHTFRVNAFDLPLEVRQDYQQSRPKPSISISKLMNYVPCKTDILIRFRYFRLYWHIYIMWVLYAVLTILLAYQCAVYAHSYVYITSSTHIVSYSIKSQSSELVHSFTCQLEIWDFIE